MKKLLKLIKNTDGQSLVESALVISFVLIPLILGMIEFGWVLNGQITLTNAAREGARAAVVCETKDKAEKAAADAITKFKTTSGLIIDSKAISVASTEFKTGNTIVVTVPATIKPIVGLFFKTDVTLTATAQMRIE